MATRLYFHATTSGLSNLPTSEQSSLTVNKSADAQTVNRSMDTTIGTSQTSVALTSNATTSQQVYYFTRFVSEELSGISSITAQTWTYNFAVQCSNAQARFPVSSGAVPVVVYVWRPSTSAVVGTIFDSTAGSCGIASAETGFNVTFSGSSVASVADGDVICIEIIFRPTQTLATAYTDTFYYDGTTVNSTNNTGVSNHASFLETPQNLTFGGALTRVSLSQTYKYNILNRVSLSRIYKYNISSRVSLSRTYRYAITGRVSLSRTYKYNIASRVSLSRTYRYAIRSRVSLSQIYKYNIVARVSLSRTYRYSIFSGARGDTSHLRSLAATHAIGILLGPLAVERSLEESFSIGDSLERLKSASRTVEDSFTITETPPDIVKTHLFDLAETFTISEQLGRAALKFRDLAESFTVSEALSKLRARTRALAESFTISDAQAILRTRGRALVESFFAEDLSLARATIKLRSFLSVETFTMSDIAVAGKAKAKALAESFTIDDTMLGTIVAKKFRDIAESFGIGEVLSRTSIKNRAPGFAETFTISDALTRLKVRGKILAESFTVTDVLTRSLSKGRSIAESFSISELLARSKSRALALAQSFTITEAVDRAKTPGRALSESFTTGETLAKVKHSLRSLAESFSLTDTLAKSLIKTRSIAQTFTITELLSRVKSKALALADSFGITDALSRSTEIALFLAESFTITEQPLLGRVKSLFIAGQFLISDLVNGVRQLAGAPQWILTGQASDFPNSLEYLLKQYINDNWSIHEPAIGASRARDIQVDNFAYDAFRTYYLKLKETGSTVTTRQIRYNTYEFETPVEIECYSRRLSKGEAYRELNNIINELLRIFGTYPHELMFGIQGVLFERISQIERISAPVPPMTVWCRRLTVSLHYYKVSIAG